MKYVTSSSTPVTEWMAVYIVHDARKTEYQVNFSTTFQIFSDLTKMVSNRNSCTRYYQINVNFSDF